MENRGMNAHYGAHRVAGSGHTPPAITQPNVQISRTSPFGGAGGGNVVFECAIMS